MKPGRYIQRTYNGWAAVEVRRGAEPHARCEKLIDSFKGPGSKARAIQFAGTNEELPRREAVA